MAKTTVIDGREVWRTPRVAAELGISPSTVTGRVRSGRIPGTAVVTDGRTRWFFADAIRKLAGDDRERWGTGKVAFFLGVEPQTVWRWTESGRIPREALAEDGGFRWYWADAIRELRDGGGPP